MEVELEKVIEMRFGNKLVKDAALPGKSASIFLFLTDQSLSVESAEPETMSRLSADQASW